MCALLEKEFTDALADEDARDINRTVTVATGCAAYPLISRLCKLAEDKFNGLNINVIKIKRGT